jgi:hypothetical protein
MLRREWLHDQRRILLPILIFRPHNPTDMTHAPARALVDTGATASAISISIADELQLQSHGKRPLQSAHGLGQAERFFFRIGIYPDQADANSFPYIFDDIFGFCLTGSEHFDALIGMDILSQCDFSINREGRCELSFG